MIDAMQYQLIQEVFSRLNHIAVTSLQLAYMVVNRESCSAVLQL